MLKKGQLNLILIGLAQHGLDWIRLNPILIELETT